MAKSAIYFAIFSGFQVKGKIPVPCIIQLVKPDKDIHGAILMDCLPGNLLNVTEINEKLVCEIDGILAKIHATKNQGYGDLTQPNQFTKSL